MMLRNYLKTAIRNFIKHRLYSTINVAGLALGLTCCLLIALYIADELGYDRQHPDAERIYRFSQTALALEEPITLSTASPQVGPLLQQDFDEVENTLRTYRSARVFLDRNGDAHEERMLFAEASLSEFFALDWLQGDPATALAEPNAVVLTRSLARKYFGEEDPLGQALLSGPGNPLTLRVTGVVEDLPYNMHISPTAFISFTSLDMTLPPGLLQNWNFANFTTYLKLESGADFAVLGDAFAATVLDNMPEAMRPDWEFHGLRVTDIHLHSPLEGPGVRSSGNLANAVILSMVGAGLLLLASINFVNLSTARALQRGKEIAVRKAIGSSRRQLFQQFMGESLLLVAIAFALALMLAELMLPTLNAFTGKTMSLQTFVASVPAVVLLGGTVCSVAFFSGCYPALYLSALRPADRAVTPGKWAWLSLRDLLVVLQFSLAIMLVIATLVVYSQVQLGKTVELGFDKEQVVVMDLPPVDFATTWPPFKNELMRHTGISAATASAHRPFLLYLSEHDVRYEGGERPAQLNQMPVDFDFFETYRVPLLAGRSFLPEYAGDRMVEPDESNPLGSAGFVLNRAAAELLGWTPEAAIGKWMEKSYPSDTEALDIRSDDFSRVARGQIVGVVENMHEDSLREAIKPTFYYLAPATPNGRLGYLSVRLTGTDVGEALAHIDAAWAKVFPGQPDTRKFLDEDFDVLYRQEERFAQLLSTFASLSIFISCLGLFGLAAFTVERRTKEIGIRKVMGSSVWRIVLLLTNDFSRLVLVANVIAWPVAYIAMSRWLQQFAYRIDLTPLIFIGSGLIALCIAWVTVGSTATKAASAKPVLALRYE